MSNLAVGTTIYEWTYEFVTPSSVYTLSIHLDINDKVYDIYGNEIGVINDRFGDYEIDVWFYDDEGNVDPSTGAAYERISGDITSTTVQAQINYVSKLSDGTNNYVLKDSNAVHSDNTSLKVWTGTKAQYNAITTKDSNTLYNITDDTSVTLNLLEILYPVGSIYITTNSTCPLSTLMSGSIWIQETTRILVDKKVPTSEDLTWYNLYSDGWCEQGGMYNRTSTGEQYITLPISFKDVNYFCNGSWGYGYSANNNANYVLDPSDETKLYSNDLNTGKFYWNAWGYTSITTNHKQFRRTA